MKCLMVKYQFAVFKDIGREMPGAIPSKSGIFEAPSMSDNIQAPLLFRLHHQHYTKKHTFLVCVL